MKVTWIWDTECHMCETFDEEIVPLIVSVIRCAEGIRWVRKNMHGSTPYSGYDRTNEKYTVSDHSLRNRTEVYENAPTQDGIPTFSTPAMMLTAGTVSDFLDIEHEFDIHRYDHKEFHLNDVFDNPKKLARRIVRRIFEFYLREEVDIPPGDQRQALQAGSRPWNLLPAYDHREFKHVQWRKAFFKARTV